ncbi:sensor histidine kinase [Pseudomonas oryzae]|uniref:Two-component system, NarL family, sensor histidine kinase UhpB n=1 Tax=Pseudomonas oryzae TaxID=1392877 RepID=A0A1H1VLD8_9PSED|nr:sensor histidine kinase [Pseudomonas oryzae]SDS85350.1 two-component system, NarL family, sensor histidine kinase UhpB [Pseudomonas oryzae]
MTAPLSALGRASLLVSGLFLAVLLVCLALLLRQAELDIRRELQAADSVARFLALRAADDPALLDASLTANLRHLELDWGDGAATSAPDNLPAGDPQGGNPLGGNPLGAWLAGRFADLPVYRVALVDGRALSIRVSPADELEEVWESLLQLLALFAGAWLLCLGTSAWLVRRGLDLLTDILRALQGIAGGALDTRLPDYAQPEARRLAGQVNAMAQALQQAGADNQTLTAALLATQERERTRLAQTLHDDLGQILAGMRAQLYLLDACRESPAQVEAISRRLQDNGEQMQQSFRSLVRDLYPVVLERLGLGEAARQLVEQWQAQQGIACELELDAPLPRLDDEARAHVYRLLQEALTNVARHAGASRVRVVLSCRGALLRLEVCDDGRGLPTNLREGVGLRSMRERARCLGAALQLHGVAPSGLRLCVEIPWREWTTCTS